MKIIADKKIYKAEAFFSGLGDLELVDGREINKALLKTADVLLVRTVTSINKELLQGTSIKFVGSATAGFDHIDQNYLEQNDIQFVYAPGGNAGSVADYVMTVLGMLAEKNNKRVCDMSVGIVGVGNVGGKVFEEAKKLAINVQLNDPLIKEADFIGVELDALMDMDIISLHLPLTYSGKHKTHNLFDTKRIAKLKPGTILINTARGDVVDEAAILTALTKKQLGSYVVDVWQNEPALNIDLLEFATIGTPHIAGYSLMGKYNSTLMVYKGLCDFFGLEVKPIDRPKNRKVKAQDIKAYDSKLRRIKEQALLKRANYFDSLRTIIG